MKASVERVERDEVENLIGTEMALPWQHVSAFRRCLRGTSEFWVGRYEGTLVCLWGVMPTSLADGKAYLWLHTTDSVGECEFTFVRQSQIAVQRMLVRYPRIIGHCRAEAERSIRWLRWLGAEFGHPSGGLVPFLIVRKDG